MKINDKIVSNMGEKLRVMELPPIKLKDKDRRNRVVLRLKDIFGFLPEILVIDKVIGENNVIRVSAIDPAYTDTQSGEENPTSAERAPEKSSGVKRDR